MQVQGNAARPDRASAGPGQPLPRWQCAHHLRRYRNGAGPLHQSQTGQASGLWLDTICLAVAPCQATVSDPAVACHACRSNAVGVCTQP